MHSIPLNSEYKVMTKMTHSSTIPAMSFQVRKISDAKKPSRDWFKFAARALLVAEPIVSIYRKWRKEKKIEEEHSRRTTLLKKIFAIAFALLLIAILLLFIAQTVFSLNFSMKSIFFSTVGTTLPTDDKGYTNFLLLGVGDDDHSGVDLTDTIIVASVDPEKTKSVVLLSVPRDLYIVKSEMGVGRINSLYRDYKHHLINEGVEPGQASLDALRELGELVSEKLNLPIHRVIKVNFSAFTEAIDALGGVDVFVERDLVDTQYPGPNYTYETFILTSGLQHLDGETALKYVRSRHSTSDFSRSERQQQVITAAAEKAKSMKLLSNVKKITELYRIFSNNTETSMTLGEIVSAAQMGDELDRSRVINMQLTAFNEGGFLYPPPREEFEGASVLLPTSNTEYGGFDLIQTFTSLIFYQRGIFIVKPKIAVLNAGASPGAAGVLGAELARYGFNVVDTANTDDAPATSIASRPVSEDEHDPNENSLIFLSGLLQMSTGTFPTNAELEQPADIIITLGPDYRFQTIEKLIPPSWVAPRIAKP